MQKYVNLFAGFALGLIFVYLAGLVSGVPGVCVYTNSCSPEKDMVELRAKVDGYAREIVEKNRLIKEESERVMNLQSKLTLSIDKSKEILEKINEEVDPSLTRLRQIIAYVEKEKEIEKHVNKILCDNNIDPGGKACSG